MESILTSIKKLLGITEDYKQFDTDIVIHINTVFAFLNQLGVGPSQGYRIKDEGDKWADFMGDDTDIEEVKSYTYMKVKLIFDPPSSSAAIESLKELIKECECRIVMTTDSKS